ncbi:10073_t:CDS:2 [Funneliformis geosporum]|nr:10073_t:CDS:2 [Funneliformis geosporum]
MQEILPSNGETERGRERGSSRSRAQHSRSPRVVHTPKLLQVGVVQEVKTEGEEALLEAMGVAIEGGRAEEMTTEKDLQNIFERYGRVNNVTIVYDHRSDRSRGFGFVYMNSIDESTIAKEKTNGMEVNGRNMRVDYSLTQRPHTPTPGEYMGDRPRYRTSYSYRRTPSASPTRFRRKSPTRSKSRSWSRDRRKSRSRSYSKKRNSYSRARRSRSYSH